MRPKESRRASLDQFLLALRAHLLSLPPLHPQNPLVAARELSQNGIAVPLALPHPTQETKWTVAFEPPSDIHVVGSWANKISVKKKGGRYFGVDLAIEMPSVRRSPSCSHTSCLIHATVSVPRERLFGCSILPQAFLLPRCSCAINIHLLPGGRFLWSTHERSTADSAGTSTTKR